MPDKGHAGFFDNRYVLWDLLGAGGMGQVFAAYDRLTQQAVALKSLPRGGGDAVRLALAQEFQTLATLRHPHIISVLDYGFDRAGRPYFTMELLRDARPLLPFAAAVPRAVKLELLIQLLRALTYLHRREILHRDLKPHNILVLFGEQGLSVKVLDFGLALIRSEAQVQEIAAAGTLAYIAPELLRGEPAQPASDFYAVGIMAYEMFAGTHPFSIQEGPAKLIMQVLYQQPDLEPIEPALRPLFARLLSKDKAARPSDAESLMRELGAASGMPLPGEPVAVRDSHLVAARFVGREAELSQLCQALERTAADPSPAWIVAGESGVGKSRLLEEQRSRALVRGMMVVRGRTVQSHGTAYHLWLDVLRVLALHIELDELELSVLGTLVPELGALLKRRVAPPPELDAQGTRLRLLHTLRRILLRATGPLLLQLEDLQWADGESLELLRHVTAERAEQRLSIVATLRDAEAPQLCDSLPAMQVLRLQPLDRASLELLCASILGPAAREPKLIELIERETAGNAFFVVEVLRALAERSGSLGRIGQGSLPQQVLAGGIEQVLNQRLLHVPAPARPFLHLCAVAGRVLDTAMLSRSQPHYEEWIRQCAEAGVLDMSEQLWRFRHDKLREHVLREIPPAALRELHHTVAMSLEGAYPDSAQHAPQIAYHYREAQKWARAAALYALAGETALQRGTAEAATVLFQQALALHRQLPVTRLESVKVWRGLALSWFGLGRLPETERALRHVCELVGAPLPTAGLGLVRALLQQAAEQAVRRAGVDRLLLLRTRSEAKRELLPELMLALGGADLYVWLGQPALSLLRTLWGLNLAESLGAREQRTYFLASLAYFLSNTPLRLLSRRYLKLAEPTLIAGTRAEIDYLRASAMIYINEGRFRQAAEKAARAVACARRSRDDVSLMHSLQQAQIVALGQDDYAHLLDCGIEMERLAAATANPHYLVFARIGQGVARLRRGEFELATAAVQNIQADRATGGGVIATALAQGVAALSAYRQGQPLRAVELADATVKAVRGSRWRILQLRVPLCQALEVYLTDEAQESEQLEEALRLLRQLAQRYAIARPNALLYLGRYNWQRGYLVRALLQIWHSLRAAERVGARYDKAQAHYWLGVFGSKLRLSLAGGAYDFLLQPGLHLRTAHTLFSNLGAAWDKERTDAALRAYLSQPPSQPPS